MEIRRKNPTKTPATEQKEPEIFNISATNTLSVVHQKLANAMLAQITALERRVLTNPNDEDVCKQLTGMVRAHVQLHKEHRETLAAEKAAASHMTPEEALEQLAENPAFIERLALNESFTSGFLRILRRRVEGVSADV